YAAASAATSASAKRTTTVLIDDAAADAETCGNQTNRTIVNWQPGTPLNIDTPTKSTGNTDNGLMKKLKEFDGLAMSLGNGNPHESNGDERKRSRHSSETEGSTDGSDGNTTGAETEELARKVEALTAENMALRSELNQLNEKSDKLRGANATLLDKLKSSEPEKRVKNSGTGDIKNKNQGESESNSSSKLHQLLDTKPRADGVAAR
uniref:Uncharacterized protein n=1 Tax=Brassica oleracea var. oleracea TaxID=109376 RepID=A0A0D2ZTN3_BRAOL